ncbi:hypothetical protein C8R44DRAFT_863803 [Mycena epipterygia]|nr:hypothetical protein C8R44DRAFT_863803 [Mycena epipterygia]
MARGKHAAQKAAKNPYPLCKWCNKRRDGCRFDKHQKYCKEIYSRPRGRQIRRDHSNALDGNREQSDAKPSQEHIFFSPPLMDINNIEPEQQELRSFIEPLLPGSYLRIIPHPHSTDPTPVIIPIDSANRPTNNGVNRTLVPDEELPGHAPWFPFKWRANFQATEITVKGLLSKELTDSLFSGASSTWSSSGHSHITLQNHKQMESVLSHAHKYGVRFKSGQISATYEGEVYNIVFGYRDPWEWITKLLEDDTLGPHLIFNSVCKYYCEGTVEETWCERVIDEPNTADTWDEYESELPDADPFPHCLLPLHFWIDDGLMTKRDGLPP